MNTEFETAVKNMILIKEHDNISQEKLAEICKVSLLSMRKILNMQFLPKIGMTFFYNFCEYYDLNHEQLTDPKTKIVFSYKKR